MAMSANLSIDTDPQQQQATGESLWRPAMSKKMVCFISIVALNIGGCASISPATSNLQDEISVIGAAYFSVCGSHRIILGYTKLSCAYIRVPASADEDKTRSGAITAYPKRPSSAFVTAIIPARIADGLADDLAGIRAGAFPRITIAPGRPTIDSIESVLSAFFKPKVASPTEYVVELRSPRFISVSIQGLKREVVQAKDFWEKLQVVAGLAELPNGDMELLISVDGDYYAGGRPPALDQYRSMVSGGFSEELRTYAARIEAVITAKFPR